MKYKPLPNRLTISRSSVDGLRLFAVTRIPAGTVLGCSHVRDDRFSNNFIRTPLGGFINHSNNPNCFITTEAGDRTLYAIKPIKKGDELTVFYRFKGYDGIINSDIQPDVGG